MYQVENEQVETIHLYVVRDEEKRPFIVLPVLVALLCIGAIISVTYYSAIHPAYQYTTLKVSAIVMPPHVFRTTTNIIPTGVQTYPATYANGVLTFTNGSVIGQSVPPGFTVGGVATDQAAYVPAGSADGYGYARVSAHALTAGRGGNVSTLAINAVIGSSLYIRNLSAFSGGRDAYSIKYVTEQDKQAALSTARDHLTIVAAGLHYPCSESSIWSLSVSTPTVSVNWHCKFVTYHIPAYMHVTSVHLIGKNLIVAVWFVAPIKRIWVK